MPRVVSATGEQFDVPDNEVQQMVDAGARVMGPDELARQEARAKYGDTANTAATYGLGIADAVSLGFGKGAALKAMDYIDPNAAQVGREYMQGLEQANPYAYTAGQITGVVAPAILSGGESLLGRGGAEAGALGLGRALGGPQTVLTALGEGGANLVERGLGRGILGKTVGGIAQGALEGGVYGAGQTFSEAEIENKPLTAELMLAGIGKGALLGGTVGGALGGGGAILGKAARGLKRFVPDAEELAFKATGAKLRDYQKLAKVGSEPNVIGRFILDELPQLSKKPFERMSKEDINVASHAFASDMGKRVGAHIDDLVRPGVTPDAAAIGNRMRREVWEPLSKVPGWENVAKKVDDYVESFESHAGVVRDGKTVVNPGTVNFKELHEFRQGLDDLIFRNNKILSEDAIVKELRHARSIMEEEIESQGGKVGGADWAKGYGETKKAYSKARTVAEITDKEIARESANRSISLTDTIAGAGAFAALGPKGLLLAGANKLMRTYGDQVAASVLDRVAKLNAAQMAAKQTQQALRGSIKGFMSSGPVSLKGGAARGLMQMANYEDHANQVRALASSPDMLAQHVATHGPDARHAPDLHANFASAQARAVAYLNQQMPRGLVVQSMLTPSIHTQPTKQQKNEWLRKFAIYSDPMAIVKAMQKGNLTYDDVDALKAMYPEIHKDMQTMVLEEMQDAAASGTLPSYTKRAQLSILTGAPADATFEPDFIASQQAAYQSSPGGAQEEGAAPPPEPGAPLRIASQLDTESQRLEQR